MDRSPGRRIGVALLTAALMAIATAVTACGSTEGTPVRPQHEDLDTAATTETTATAFTNRLPAGDPVTQAIVLTQTTYPATREENAAGAIILTIQDPAIAFTAMHRITHMPVNAPLLYLDEDGRLPEATRNEMRRLRPDGVMQDGRTQVYIAGPFDASVVEEVEGSLGYKVRTIGVEDPVKLAERLDRWHAALKSNHADEVIVSALDHPQGIAHGIGAMGWNAHMGRGFAWVYRDSVPEPTRRLLQRRYGDSYIYLTGGEDVITPKVAQELAEYGPVRRIAGPDVFASNAVNAGYKDFGRNWGYWWDVTSRSLGWGIAQAGHNFIIGSAEDVLGLIPAAVLGHMGKHGPILLVERDSVPTPTRDYLEMVRPGRPSPNETILNFAWIIGDDSRVSPAVQDEITRLLAPRPPVAEAAQEEQGASN